MRILHAPYEVSGQLGLSVRGLCEIGHTARSFCEKHRFGYEAGPGLTLKSRDRRMARLELFGYIAWFIAYFDVFHFHYGLSLLGEPRRHADARLFRRLGKRVIVQFWGSEARVPSLAASRNPHFVNGRGVSDECVREKMRRWAEITGGHVICCDPTLQVGLREYFPFIHRVEALVDTDRLQPRYPQPETTAPVVVHAPSHEALKGTAIVRESVARLQAQGLRFDYVQVQDLSHSQALEVYSTADLVIDQLRLGHYGCVSAEAMALGKPVICYISPEAMSAYPEGFPIINADPCNLADVLEEWLQRPEDRRRLGMRSREYAERVFDYRIGAQRLIEIYRSLPRQ